MGCRSYCCTTVLAVIGLVFLAVGAFFPYQYVMIKQDLGGEREAKKLLMFGFDRQYCYEMSCPDDASSLEQVMYCCKGQDNIKYSSAEFMPGVGSKKLRVLGDITLAAGVIGTFCALLATLAAFSRCCCKASPQEQLTSKPHGLTVFVNLMAFLLSVAGVTYYALRISHVFGGTDLEGQFMTSWVGSSTTGSTELMWGPLSLCFTMVGALFFLINSITLCRHRSRVKAHDNSMPLVVSKPGQAYNYVEHIDVQTYN